jgi:hypothetical protein
MSSTVESVREKAREALGGSDAEGGMARPIEALTAKLPSDTFLWLAGGSIAASLTLKIMGRGHDALFVGQWAPTFLILGLYNKMVKQLGHDKYDRTSA